MPTTKHQRILRFYEDCVIDVIERSLNNLGNVEIVSDVIGCANGVSRHVDPADVFDPWSAFYVVHNDSCIVWGQGGVRLCPKEGERFLLNINLPHAVYARRHGHQIFAAVVADGKSKREATSKLAAYLREASA